MTFIFSIAVLIASTFGSYSFTAALQDAFDSEPEPQTFGALSPFTSSQLAASPANGNCLTTNGSANAWSSDCGSGGGGAFSTTSVDYWKTVRNFFSTTSADYWGSTKGYLTTVDISANTNAASGNGVTVNGDAFDFDCSDVTDSDADDGVTCTTEDIVVSLGAAITTGEITDGTIIEPDLDVDDSPADGECLAYDTTGTNFEWVACGSGGSGGGTWSTTTSQTAGILTNYPNNDDDIVTIGSNSTTTAEIILDPNTSAFTIGTGGAGDSTFAVGPNTSNQWLFGYDETDKSFQIASSTALGTTPALTISKTGLAATFAGSLTVSGTNFIFGGDTFDELVGDGLDLSSGDLIFDCSDVAGTGITCSGEDITAEVITAGDGLTKTALDFDCDTASGSVFGCLSSTDWTTFNNSVDTTLTLTVAGTANQLTSSAGAQDLSTNRTWTLSLPNHVIFPGNFKVTNSTTTNATSTALDITNLLTFGGVTGNSWDDFCLSITGGSGLCDGSDGGGSSFPFTATTNYAQTVYATSTPTLWFQSGLLASSTSYFTDILVGSAGEHAAITGNAISYTAGAAITAVNGLLIYGDSASPPSALLTDSTGVGINNGSFTAYLDPAALTADRSFAFPDLAGTFALTGTAQTIDFSGGVLEIPNGTGPTVDATGEVAIDTTSDQLVGFGATTKHVYGNGYIYPAFTYATSTAWSGTTTIPLGPAFVGETWNGVMCFTDAGTLFVQFTDATNHMNSLQASTTVGTVTLSSNNTFTAAEKRYVNVGTPASSPTKISCTLKKEITAD